MNFTHWSCSFSLSLLSLVYSASFSRSEPWAGWDPPCLPVRRPRAPVVEPVPRRAWARRPGRGTLPQQHLRRRQPTSPCRCPPPSPRLRTRSSLASPGSTRAQTSSTASATQGCVAFPLYRTPTVSTFARPPRLRPQMTACSAMHTPLTIWQRGRTENHRIPSAAWSSWPLRTHQTNGCLLRISTAGSWSISHTLQTPPQAGRTRCATICRWTSASRRWIKTGAR